MFFMRALLLLTILLAGQWRRVEPPKPEQQQPAQRQPEEGVVFRTGTTWVRVDAQAGEKQALLTNLGKEDFVIFDEGVPQPIGYFGRESEQLDLVLLLDVSGSMRRHLKEVAATGRSALQQLHPGDRAAVLVFGRNSELREPLTADFSRIELALKDAAQPQELGAGTQINPAIVAAAEHLKANGGTGRRAVLILTDNQALHYRTPDEEAVRALLAADTVLNAIVTGNAERPEKPKPGVYTNPDFTPADVWGIADETGGEAIKAGNTGASFREMIERIRTRYSIQYRAPEGAAAGTFRRIRVDLAPEARRRHPKAWVRARSGYVVR
jgi:VWFA-related protein